MTSHPSHLIPNTNTDPNPGPKPDPSPDPSPHLTRTTGDFTPLLLFGPVSDTRCHGFVAYLLLSVSMAIVRMAIVSIAMAIDSWHTRYYRVALLYGLHLLYYGCALIVAMVTMIWVYSLR